jgi:hypothetical protein
MNPENLVMRTDSEPAGLSDQFRHGSMVAITCSSSELGAQFKCPKRDPFGELVPCIVGAEVAAPAPRFGRVIIALEAQNQKRRVPFGKRRFGWS